MKCHALNCDKPALTGMPPCYDHWMMLPAKVRARRPWVEARAHNARIPVEMPVNASRLERGQMELFA